MEKLNLVEMLKDCPSGMELNCVMYDNVSFDKVSADEKSVYPIFCYITDEKGNRSGISFTENGCESKRFGAKCVIFPKGKTTWEGFQRPFKDGDIVTWEDRGSLVACIYKERKNTASFNYHIALYNGSLGVVVNGEIALTDDELCIATEEEKQKLFDAIKSNGYKWDPKIKTLEKLPEFKAGDVLVSRTGNIVLCSNIDDNQVVHFHCILTHFGEFVIKNDIGVGKSFHCTLATAAERQRLFDELKSSGYKYNPQTNKLEELIESKEDTDNEIVMSGIYFDRKHYANEVELHLGNYEIEIRDGKTYAIFKNQETKTLKPKFKVGDRIKEKKAYISGIITDISDGTYKVEYKNGGVAYANIEFQDGWELVPNKFDLTTLKPFDKVLVRDGC